jgi:hypothetical protein
MEKNKENILLQFSVSFHLKKSRKAWNTMGFIANFGFFGQSNDDRKLGDF